MNALGVILVVLSIVAVAWLTIRLTQLLVDMNRD